MTTAHLTYATIGLALGWRVIFCWFKWWLAPIIASARKKGVAQDYRRPKKNRASSPAPFPVRLRLNAIAA